jgi:uncharacterized protein (TIGR03085 family)
MPHPARIARTERAALADLLQRVGPDRPTLCEGWLTADLCNHLLVRERRPDAAAGLVLRPLTGWMDRVTAGYAALPWGRRLRLLRTGPPVWSPLGWGRLDELVNGIEYFIHHEDVRRGSPGWQPRELDPDTTLAVTTALRRPGSAPGLRRVRAGVTAVLDDGTVIRLRGGKDPAAGAAEVHGAPAEVLLWASGRSAARVRVDGDGPAMAELRHAGLGG